MNKLNISLRNSVLNNFTSHVSPWKCCPTPVWHSSCGGCCVGVNLVVRGQHKPLRYLQNKATSARWAPHRCWTALSRRDV